MADKKLLIGPKVRRLRKEQQLSQAQMAADLEISPAYLNLIEHNQRPVTAQVLVKIASTYDIDLPQFAKDDSPEYAAQFAATFAAAGLEEFGLGPQDFEDLSNLSLEAREAVIHLAERGPSAPTPQAAPTAGNAIADMRAFLDARHNYFPNLEERAIALRQELGLQEMATLEETYAALSDHVPFTITYMPPSVMGTTLRRYDMHGKRLLLNTVMPLAARLFQILSQLTVSAHVSALNAALAAGDGLSERAAEMARVRLSGYVAAAVLMPYDSFLLAAQTHRFDLQALALEFGVSLEQAAHRLATLGNANARGPACALLKFDGAGHLTKAVGGAQFPELMALAHSPAWQVHRQPRNRPEVEWVSLGSGTRLLTLAFTRRAPALAHDRPLNIHRLALIMGEADGQATVYGPPSDALTPLTSSHLAYSDQGAAGLLIDQNRREMAPLLP